MESKVKLVYCRDCVYQQTPEECDNKTCIECPCGICGDCNCFLKRHDEDDWLCELDGSDGDKGKDIRIRHAFKNKHKDEQNKPVTIGQAIDALLAHPTWTATTSHGVELFFKNGLLSFKQDGICIGAFKLYHSSNVPEEVWTINKIEPKKYTFVEIFKIFHDSVKTITNFTPSLVDKLPKTQYISCVTGKTYHTLFKLSHEEIDGLWTIIL